MRERGSRTSTPSKAMPPFWNDYYWALLGSFAWFALFTRHREGIATGLLRVYGGLSRRPCDKNAVNRAAHRAHPPQQPVQQPNGVGEGRQLMHHGLASQLKPTNPIEQQPVPRPRSRFTVASFQTFFSPSLLLSQPRRFIPIAAIV